MRHLAAILLVGSLPAQSVWTVDDDPGADFTEVQAAIDAAAPGDTVLILDGSYASFWAAKPLSIVAFRNSSVSVESPVTISGIGAGESLVLQGVHVQQPALQPLTLVALIWGCAGSVRIEDCQFDPGSGGVLNLDSVVVSDCSAISFVRCESTGRESQSSSVSDLGDALEVIDSTLHLYDCELTGGRGPSSSTGGSPSSGGAGLWVDNSTVRVHGSTIMGGDGGSGAQPFTCTNGADGGPSAVIVGAASLVTHVDSSWIGGNGGTTSQPCSQGLTGPQFEMFGGTAVANSGSSYELSTERVALEGNTIQFSIAGPPGDSIVLGLAADHTALYVPVIESSLLLDPSTFVAVPLGALDANGTLNVQTVVSTLNPGTAVLTLHAQVFGLGVAGPRAGAAQTLTLLDA